MPLVEVTLGAGRTPAQVRALIHELHEATVRSVGALPEHVTVIVREIPRAHWAKSDVTLSEMDAAAPPSAPSTTTVSQEPT